MCWCISRESSFENLATVYALVIKSMFLTNQRASTALVAHLLIEFNEITFGVYVSLWVCGGGLWLGELHLALEGAVESCGLFGTPKDS